MIDPEKRKCLRRFVEQFHKLQGTDVPHTVSTFQSVGDQSEISDQAHLAWNTAVLRYGAYLIVCCLQIPYVARKFLLPLSHHFKSFLPIPDVTHILSQIKSGDPAAAEQLLPLVYAELRKLAEVRMAHEAPDQTLQATALVHEAYIRLVDVDKAQHWDSRGHFFAAAAEAIRRILVENARRKGRIRHGGGRVRVDLEQVASMAEDSDDGLLALNETLIRFAAIEPAKAELVNLRYFAGCSIDEAADLLGISRTTAKRYWAFARAWLLAELHDSDNFRNS